MVDPNGIPRYEQPSWDELAEEDMTSAEAMEKCIHCGACQTALVNVLGEKLDDVLGGREFPDALDCIECDEWESW